jgi:hypothetical protein
MWTIFEGETRGLKVPRLAPPRPACAMTSFSIIWIICEATIIISIMLIILQIQALLGSGHIGTATIS